jgi:uncharacterized protein
MDQDAFICDIADRLPEMTKKYYFRFKICPDCRRIFWEGSHFERMKEKIDSLMANYPANGAV